MLTNYLNKEYVMGHREKNHLLNPAHISKYLSLADIYIGSAAEAILSSGEASSLQIKNCELGLL